MVSQSAMIGMGLQAFISFVFPMALFVYYYKFKNFSIKPVIVGMFVFVIFSQILEKLLHVYVLQINDVTRELFGNPWLFATYGALAAGVFEEVGRYLGFRLLLPRNRGRLDGMAMGIGHGGIEAMMIGAIGGIQSLSFASMLNKGTLEQTFIDKIPMETLQELITQLIETPAYMYILGGFERVVAVLIHIALTLMVVHSLRKGKAIILLYAILIHAAIDFVPGLYQAGVVPFEIIQLYLILLFGFSITAISKSKQWFTS